MTIDERLEFLVQSTESLHSSTQKNTDQIADLARQLSELADTVGKLAMVAISHEKRLWNLEE